jgi:hypothetical protein
MNPAPLSFIRIALLSIQYMAGSPVFFWRARRLWLPSFRQFFNAHIYHNSYTWVDRIFNIFQPLAFPLFSPFSHGKRPETRVVTGNFRGAIKLSNLAFFC